MTRAGSGDASLSALLLSGVTRMPAFASETMAYTASVGNAVTETTVSATAATGASYEVRLDGAVDQDGIVPLAVGSNTIAVVVTAQDGETMQTCAVAVVRHMQRQADRKRRGAGMIRPPDFEGSPSAKPGVRVRHG